MKHTKKLIPALGMLLLSACMLVTSTFAWFSMNTEVSATNMQVTAKGDQVYLQIQTSGTSFVDGQAQTTIAATTNTEKYVPTNVYKTFDATTPGAYDGTATFVWVTATSKDPAVSTKHGNYTQVETSALTKYAYKTSYDLRLDPNAGAVAGGKLKVTGVAFEGTAPTDDIADSVCVLIVCAAENLSMLYTQDTAAGTFAAKTGSAETLTAAGFPAGGTIKTVDVYVFFNGDHANCKTANVTANSYKVSVTFNVDAD